MRAESLTRTGADPAVPEAGGWVVIDPRWRRRFERRGMTAACDFLNLRGDVIGGHADRHVVRVVFGRGLSRTVCYLKREHRVPWRERLRNWLAGFGWSSKSEREAQTLRELHRAGLGVPRWLACGEDDEGRAFLLLRAVPEAIELRRFLSVERPADQRRFFACRLGRLLARVHAAGFDCPDICAKHVLVRPRGSRPILIDWQRTVGNRRVRWGVRIGELAALDATVADDLAAPRDRLACLRAYLRSAVGGRAVLRPWVDLIRRRTERLLHRRSVREQRRPPLQRAQALRWIDGESLVMTRPVWRACRGRVPTWLAAVSRSAVPKPRESVLKWRGRTLVLRQFPPMGRLRLWWNRLRGRHEVAAGPRLAGQFFRNERCGVPAPRPLAFGQRPDSGSFVLFSPESS
jgi:hypothetical protein